MKLISCLGLFFLFATSCKQKSYSIVGQWELTYNWAKNSQFEKNIVILFLADSTFIATDISKNEPGIWNQKGNHITLVLNQGETQYSGTIMPEKHLMEGSMVNKGDTGTWRATRFNAIKTSAND